MEKTSEREREREKFGRGRSRGINRWKEKTSRSCHFIVIDFIASFFRMTRLVMTEM